MKDTGYNGELRLIPSLAWSYILQLCLEIQLYTAVMSLFI